MALQVYNFSQIVSNIATAIQASASTALNFTAGSVLRAISEAVSGVVLWLQAIILQLLTLTRAATSVGADLDSWCADFGFFRLAARAATGQVTFSRFTATQQAVVPIDATGADRRQHPEILRDHRYFGIRPTAPPSAATSSPPTPAASACPCRPLPRVPGAMFRRGP